MTVAYMNRMKGSEIYMMIYIEVFSCTSILFEH